MCPVRSSKGSAGSAGAPRNCECVQIAELEAILASTLDPVITIDSSGRIRSASNSVEKVFGWRSDELIGQNVNVLMPEPHHSRHDQYLSSYRKTLKTSIVGRTREFEAVRRNGARFPIELSISRADVYGQSLPLFVGIIKDVSERKRVENELELNRKQLDATVRERTRELEESHTQLRIADRLAAIGTLAAGLGHDMNNVLLPVRTRMNALESMALPKAAASHLAHMRKACGYLQQLTDGLHMLALSSEEEDSTDVATDLYEWWTTVGLLLAKAVPKGVRFVPKLGGGLPRVPIAPHRLTQAVLNLIVNAGQAIQAMPKRPRRPAVRLSISSSPDNREVSLRVADNGSGMTPEVRARAFDAFFSTRTRGLGTGLGLPLVRSVVVNAGGTIDIETELGKGSEIVLTLPARDVRQRDQSERAATVCVLDRRVASMAVHILESGGWHVTRTNSRPPQLSPQQTIWVTEPCSQTLKAAQAFLANEGRAVVTLGEPEPRESWARLGAIVVEHPRNFHSLRDAIGKAIAFVTAVHQ